MENKALNPFEDTTPIYSNHNILDNARWDKREYIINQRGQTSYKGDGVITIDRWAIFGNGTVSVADGYISLAKGNMASTGLSQAVEHFPFGRRVTFSVLLSDGTLYSGTTDGISADVPKYTTTMVYSGSNLQLYYQVVDGYVRCFVTVLSASINLAAAKLELGGTQTLAHKEDGKWVLNDPPANPSLELIKCQWYQVVLSRIANASGGGTGHICTAAELEAGKLGLNIPVPAHMRNVCPTVTTSGTIRAVYLEPGASGFKSISLTLSPSDYMEISNNMIYISVPTGSSIPVGSMGWVDVLSNGYVLIDRNLI